MNRNTAVAKFELGPVFITQGVNAAFRDSKKALLFDCLTRHQTGDWGDLCTEDAQMNERALSKKTRIMSVYKLDPAKIYIITEHDRSLTTILLPEEY